MCNIETHVSMCYLWNRENVHKWNDSINKKINKVVASQFIFIFGTTDFFLYRQNGTLFTKLGCRKKTAPNLSILDF